MERAGRLGRSRLDAALPHVPTSHVLFNADARFMPFLEPESVHLVLTSPPYWTLKDYEVDDGQLGYVEDYETFLAEIDKVWEACYHALVPGGRLICVVGDVCLSRRKNKGVHMVMPLHASIQEHCRSIGFTNLAPIIWHKIANASYEAAGNGAAFLGKPYEPTPVFEWRSLWELYCQRLPCLKPLAPAVGTEFVRAKISNPCMDDLPTARLLYL